MEYTVPVQRMAERLDEERPGWFKEINLGTLAMEDCQNCVVGQLYGDYTAGMGELGIHILKEGVTYGVDINDIYGGPESSREHLDALADAEYSKMEDAWREEINSRLNFEREVDSMLGERKALELEATYA
jgi:hypothetical protein